ncbi:Spy/CpxP family protein refolding chaperone [Ulvibacterium sp.]|uniref:Spy/CpxP family protein refolding chaperone n=1 Tax=Ulvibacterium sp. TaxID=2665914 RepID=UPI00260C4A0A|nr:Spy/CpxP family protein refolding chaperone [Ulvibacterium sp.]
MKKNLLLSLLMIFLMVMNGVLLYMTVKEPDGKPGPPRDFIFKELNFTAAQRMEFQEINAEHHRKMRALDDRTRKLKELLFSNLGSEGFSDQELDSITSSIGNLSQEREKEIFSFFNTLERMCDAEQKRKLKRIVRGALRRPGPGGGPPPPPPHR